MVINGKKINSFCQIMLLCLILCVSPVRMYNMYNADVGFIYNILDGSLVLLSLLVCCLNIRSLKKPLFFEAIVIIFIVLHYIIFIDNREYIIFTFSHYWMYGVMIFLCVYIMDYDNLVKALIVSAVVVFFADVCLINTSSYIRLITEYEYGGVGAVLSYSLLFPGIMFLFMTKTVNKWCIVPSICSFICIVVYGAAKVAIFSYIVGFCYFIFMHKRKSNIKHVVSVAGFGIISVLFIIHAEAIFVFVLNLFGIDFFVPRLLTFISQGGTIAFDDRFGIWQFFIDKIFSLEGVVGYGIVGDRTINYLYNHQYAHNFIIQILIECGLFVGSIIIVFLIKLFINVIRMNTVYNDIIPVLVFSEVLSLFFSGTFWTSNFFWMLIAVCLSILFPIHNSKAVVSS